MFPCFIWRWMEKDSWGCTRTNADPTYSLAEKHQLLTIERKKKIMKPTELTE